MREMASGEIPSICSFTKADMAISGSPATETEKVHKNTMYNQKTANLNQKEQIRHNVLNAIGDNKQFTKIC